MGKPAATVFAEAGTDRHFIIELTFSAVVGFLGGKFLDGFAEGLGINDLGKSVGRKVREVVTRLGKLILETEETAQQKQELEACMELLEAAADRLAAEAANTVALSSGEKAVAEALREKGLPPAEAQRIAVRIGGQIFLTNAP